MVTALASDCALPYQPGQFNDLEAERSLGLYAGFPAHQGDIQTGAIRL